MSGFADLVARANPALIGGGCTITITEARDLSRTFIAQDDAGAPVDLTGATGVCTIYDDASNPILTLTFTGTTTGFTITGTAANLTGLAGGAEERTCYWELSILMGGQKLQAWSANNSQFNVWGA